MVNLQLKLGNMVIWIKTYESILHLKKQILFLSQTIKHNKHKIRTSTLIQTKYNQKLIMEARKRKDHRPWIWLENGVWWQLETSAEGGDFAFMAWVFFSTTWFLLSLILLIIIIFIHLTLLFFVILSCWNDGKLLYVIIVAWCVVCHIWRWW